MQDPFSNAKQQLQELAGILKLSESQVDWLIHPQTILRVSLPVKLDNGTIKVFTGFRSQHNNARGPYKGGIRFHPQVSESEVMALSMWMTWKCAIANIPYGGGKGGIIVDPKALSEGELERLTRSYAKAISPIIGEDKDIPAPDVNTDPQIMEWMLSEYEQVIGHKAPATFTGKPIELGGSEGRTEATGFGGVYVLSKFLSLQEIEAKGKTVAIQGFGNVGSFFAKAAFDAGFTIIALSDSKGGIVSESGINPYTAESYKQSNRSFAGFPHTRSISNEELLVLPCDILVPSALEHVITSENARAIQAKIIVEMANGPVDPEADPILLERDIVSIPDVLANSGGVTVSYFEWVQNKAGEHWEKSKVLEQLRSTIETATEESVTAMRGYSVSLRMGAYVNAVKRVVEHMTL